MQLLRGTSKQRKCLGTWNPGKQVFDFWGTSKFISASPPGGGGGGTLIFSHIRRLGPFFGVQNSEFQYFFEFSEK